MEKFYRICFSEDMGTGKERHLFPLLLDVQILCLGLRQPKDNSPRTKLFVEHRAEKCKEPDFLNIVQHC
jgi:hypothetical protein